MKRTLRGRIVRSFVSFAVCVAAVFGLATAIFVYTVEDSLFESMLVEEANRLERDVTMGSSALPGAWPRPSADFMTVYESIEQLPADLRATLAEEPRRREFAGDSGRHYHVRALFRGDAAPAAWLVAEVSDRLVVRPMRRALLVQWLVIECVMLALAVALALRVSRRIAQPLTSLAQAVHAIDVTKPQALVVVDADQEVSSVLRAFESMRSRVQAFIAREQQFTRDASHELRTPLSVIRSATAQAIDDPGMSERTRELLRLAQEGAEQLERTVASLLALAREHTRSESVTNTLVLPALERIVVEQAALRDLSAWQLQIDVSATASLPVSDSVLHILLSNLIGNAFAHADAGVISVSMNDGVFRVANPASGDIGVDPHELTVAGMRRAESPGYGLGLSIVERLCERCGLVMSIAPVTDGTFAVTLQPGVSGPPVAPSWSPV
jgi:signal transduction histidine kinase